MVSHQRAGWVSGCEDVNCMVTTRSNCNAERSASGAKDDSPPFQRRVEDNSRSSPLGTAHVRRFGSAVVPCPRHSVHQPSPPTAEAVPFLFRPAKGDWSVTADG